MEIKYQSGLPHQQRAVDAIVQVLNGVRIDSPCELYENPRLDLSDSRIAQNIRVVQATAENNVPAEWRKAKTSAETLTLDIKMETGTGKTYVYVHTIYELHKRFGINKFIIAVPSLAIKEGAKSFIIDNDVRRHFGNACGYDAEIHLSVLQTLAKKKGRPIFPSSVSDFVRGTYQIQNRIHVLLVNMGLLSDRKEGMLMRSYDTAVADCFQPYEALKKTRPFLIIDEPHRFSRDQKTFEIITKMIAPQCVIRFGATFPNITIGSGKGKVVTKDYENLLYNLNACQAFNQSLVKSVAKEHFESPSGKNEKIKVSDIAGKETATFIHISANGSRSYTLRKGDSLAMISPDMEGVNIDNIGKDSVEFSNGQTKHKGEEFDVTIYAASYQEAMLKLAIKRHFETERKNFNRSQRIKTLALFFIDDIQSFRGDEKGEKAWLRESFNRLLKARIETELREDNSPEYADYLRVSLQNLNECSAGYFAQDNNDSDEAVAQEVDDILRNKKKLLVFKDEKDNWNIRRFLFSKWTLKEGWDNPNVFTIAKLRSSGSDISKIQEVGRGLRLPVDEYGNRIGNEEFTLNYIVDFKEADFANRLVAEINGDATSVANALKITDEQLEKAAEKRGIDKKKLFIELLSKDYIDTDKNIISDNTTSFYDEYPEFKPADVVSKSKITDRNKQQTNMVKIRKKQYAELKELWERINRKYVVFFDKTLNKNIEDDFHLNDDTFTQVYITSHRSEIAATENEAHVVCDSGVQYELNSRPLPYNAFLKRIALATSLPITLIHKKVSEYFKKRNEVIDKYDDLINERSMTNFINQFNGWKTKNFIGQLHYKSANYDTKETALTDVNGRLKDEIPQGMIGANWKEGSPSAKYLYEGIASDSELEEQNITTNIDEVIVFGKIPRRSIAIPTAIGNYSPDFMYVVKRKDGRKELNVVIETKGVEKDNDPRDDEKFKINCAEELFKQLQADGFDVRFSKQTKNKTIKKIVEDLME